LHQSTELDVVNIAGRFDEEALITMAAAGVSTINATVGLAMLQLLTERRFRAKLTSKELGWDQNPIASIPPTKRDRRPGWTVLRQARAEAHPPDAFSMDG
jgi:hypothetical protein